MVKDFAYFTSALIRVNSYDLKGLKKGLWGSLMHSFQCSLRGLIGGCQAGLIPVYMPKWSVIFFVLQYS